MKDFVFFIFRLFTFHVLRMFCRIRDFFLLLADLMMRTFSIYVLFPLILIGWGIKEFALFIYPYGWVLIFSDILLICFGDRLKQFLTSIFWKKFRVQNFLIFVKKFWTDLLKRFSTGTPWKWGTWLFHKDSSRFGTNYVGVNFILKSCQSNLYLPKSKVGLTSADEEAGAIKPRISFFSKYFIKIKLRGKEKRFRYWESEWSARGFDDLAER